MGKASFILQNFIDPRPLVPAAGDPDLVGGGRRINRIIIIRGRHVMFRKKKRKQLMGGVWGVVE